LIDLRSEKEYKKMHIKGARNMFWMNVLDEKNLAKLPKDKPIFLICYVGHTSSQVLTLLKLLGYNVTSIKYGYGLARSARGGMAGLRIADRKHAAGSQEPTPKTALNYKCRHFNLNA
jgi:rhodanese-related sulfurtransferase